MTTFPIMDRGVTIHDYIPGQPIPAIIKDPGSGEIIVNPLKKYVKPYTLSIEGASLSLAPGEISDPIPMVLDNKGHFEILEAFFKSSQPEGFTVHLFDADNRSFLMNREIHVATFASGGGTSTLYEVFGPVGSAGRPFRWAESFFMNVEEHGKVIFAVFRNLSPNVNVIRFNLHGLRWYNMQAPQKVADRMQEIYRTRFRTMPFFYTTDGFITVPAGATQSFTVRLTDEAWTEWVKSMVVKTADFRTRVSEVSTQRSYMANVDKSTPGFVPDVNVFGDGEFPFLNWETQLFEPNFKLAFEIDNTLGPDNTIWITLGCRKILADPHETTLQRPGTASGGGM